jgi:pimeloyl-ACP methyl ester carboxylesterase
MTIKRRIAALLATGALGLSATLITPAIASAAPECATAAGVTTCKGATSDGALYEFSVPSGYFTGTFFLYSHGYRAPMDLPAALGGPVNKTPATSPDATVAKTMLSLGYGIGGSGFTEQGWNVDSAVKTNAELIGIIKEKFPTIKKVVAWGTSRGGNITQVFAEKNPNLVDAVGPMCAVAQGIGQELENGMHVVYALKAFFDPTIKGFNYSAGQAGYVEMLTDINKTAVVLGKLQAAIQTGAWPDTASPAGKALQAAGIPSRSALLLTGLLAGIPTRSAHFDGTTGPGNPNDPTNSSHDLFVLALSPALGVLENIASIVGIAYIGRYDAELRAGGNVADNTATDYAALLGDNRDTFGLALGGDTAIDAMLGVLKATPRVTGNPAAMAKLDTLVKANGVISDPTIMMHTTVDALVPPGNQQWFINTYAAQYAKEVAAAKAAAKVKQAKLRKSTGNKKLVVKPVMPTVKQMVFWAEPPEKYTKFLATGSPDTSFAAPYGAGHCNFSPSQLISFAQLLAYSAERGKLPTIYDRDLFFTGSGLLDDEFYEFDLPPSLRK